MSKSDKELAVELTIAIINRFPETLSAALKDNDTKQEIHVDVSTILNSVYGAITKLGS